MRVTNLEANPARMLHPDCYHGNNVKDKATNELINWGEWKSKSVSKASRVEKCIGDIETHSKVFCK